MNSINENKNGRWPIRKLEPDEYPELVKQAGRPPKELYIRGDFPPESYKFLTVVGSRSYTDYGKVNCQALIYGLRGYPVVIVSGLALGIDAIAHEAALRAGLKTIAIPGSGLADDVIYPEPHRPLAQKILELGGCLLSPFKDEVASKKWTFPFRNRVMAALSHATLVIEAELESGSLITSKWATDLNRDIFALPGSVWSDKSLGPHQLIRAGATPITCPADLIEALGFNVAAERRQIDYSTLNPEESRILTLLAEPLPREKLLEKLGMTASAASIHISMLELKGLIEEKSGALRRI